ncbi:MULTISPECIES: uroporphyrinogen-III C-methyltransferase [unclassified Gilliamella]|uniref:uroporphyrinogen-III C-methyltransferase n=1 Tax=unclassified Gilliamella TaxID=2685620 RepID=UPI00226AAC52|nr:MULTISPECIES: uroporphyrinogen-III C-methyltransferase [unclassified Gilliamella]MCX8596902.1 uroporphyrinogen-III C-methyltransferase [Gilliamella sp. B3493]MCX8599007.1 uroporphyrinogen-III C-methyltransferase [Gilliamella sp. B3486]MCX8688983.1 uroporphyrinogen-III C-methyltransferase [Gilliamella sp. B2973]MCX8704687.1 uroporphyrinogen-III C-methyltransferase [Gilliamella sp. B3127]
MPSRYYGANATLSNISTTSFSQIKKTEANNMMNINKKETKPSSPQPEPSVNTLKAPVSKLSILAIGLTVCLGGLIYFQGYRQLQNQTHEISTLQAEIANLKQNTKASIIKDLQSNIDDAINKQNQQFSLLTQRVDRQLSDNQKAQQQLTEQVNDTNKLNEQNLNSLNERLAAVSTLDNNVWLISQANYLVHLAGRKIWSDQDYTSARLLLKSADESLAKTNDPSLLPARQAITKDINSLSQVTFVDADGIILKLLGLTESITELPLVGNYKDIDLGMNQHDDTLSNDTNTSADNVTHSTDDWSDNLLANASTFMDKFIKIEKLDVKDNHFSECLDKAGSDEKQIVKCQILKTPLSAEQSLYLRENIRFRLLIAAQAVPRHQELIYQQALNDTAIWVNAYFDGNAPGVKAFIDELENLQNQPISNQNIPDKLDSITELEKLMQTRVKSILGK